MKSNYKKKRKILSALFGVVLIENLNSGIFSKNVAEDLVKNQNITENSTKANNTLSDSLIKKSINVKDRQIGINLYDKAVNLALGTTGIGVIAHNLNNMMTSFSEQKNIITHNFNDIIENFSEQNNLDLFQVFGKLKLLYNKCYIKADNKLEKSVLKDCYKYTKLICENHKNNIKLDKITDDNYKDQLETILINRIVELWSTYDPEMKELSEHEIYEEFIKKKDVTNTNSWIERYDGFKDFLCTDIPLGCCDSVRSFFKNAQYILNNFNN